MLECVRAKEELFHHLSLWQKNFHVGVTDTSYGKWNFIIGQPGLYHVICITKWLLAPINILFLLLK